MASNQPLTVDKAFVMGYRAQTQWNWLIATAFLLGKLGAGLFAVALLTTFYDAALLGLFIAVIGKGAAHLAYLGKPLRCWRMLAHPQTSWISRGLWAMMVLSMFGLMALAPFFWWLQWIPLANGSAAWQGVWTITLLAALVVMVYDGFVMATSPAMALWHTALLPVLAFCYALLGGVTLHLTLSVWSGARPESAFLELTGFALFALNLLILATYLGTMLNSSAAARRGVQVLLSQYRLPFFGGVILVGLMATAVLSLLFAATQEPWLLVLVALGDVTGHYLLFYLLLKAGLFPPTILRIVR